MEDVAKDAASVINLDEESKDLKSIPPGFTRGPRLAGDEAEDSIISTLQFPIRSQLDETSVIRISPPEFRRRVDPT